MENVDCGWIGREVKVVKKDGHVKSGTCVEKSSISITIRYGRTGNLELINLETVERINVLESGLNGK